MTHVIVVGAGPAGVATALLLAQRGIQVTLIERETAFDRVFRGEGLMPSGVAALHQMGLKDSLAKIPVRKLDAWDFYVDGQRQMRVLEPQSTAGERSTHIFNQSALVQAIAEQAASLPTFTLLMGWQVQQLLWAGQTVRGVQMSDRQTTQELTADLVIAADGRYSRLRKLAGLTLAPSKTQFDVLWFKLPAPPALLAETVFTVCLQRSRQFAFYPSWDGRLQIGWIVEKGQAKAMGDRDWIEEFAQAVPTPLAAHFRHQRAALEGPIFLDVIVGMSPQWSVPGLLLMGDAAHPMAPNRAQGINMALRDAIVATNHLIPFFQDPQAQQLATVLQAIQAERQPEITAAQHLQLEEWQKIALITASPFTYFPFKALATALGRFGFTQNAWLRQQRGLRHGIVPVHLNV